MNEAIEIAFENWLSSAEGRLCLLLFKVHGISTETATATLKSAFTAGGIVALKMLKEQLDAH